MARKKPPTLRAREVIRSVLEAWATPTAERDNLVKAITGALADADLCIVDGGEMDQLVQEINRLEDRLADPLIEVTGARAPVTALEQISPNVYAARDAAGNISEIEVHDR